MTYAPCGNIYFLEGMLPPLRVVLAIVPDADGGGASSEVVETPFAAVFASWATLSVGEAVLTAASTSGAPIVWARSVTMPATACAGLPAAKPAAWLTQLAVLRMKVTESDWACW